MSDIRYKRGSPWTDFRENLYWCLLRKSVEEPQIWWKSDKNEYFKWRPTCVSYCWLSHVLRNNCCVSMATLATVVTFMTLSEQRKRTVALPWQWLRESAIILCYTYNAYLVLTHWDCSAPQKGAPLDKRIQTELVNKLPASYGASRFITVFKTAHQWAPFWASKHSLHPGFVLTLPFSLPFVFPTYIFMCFPPCLSVLHASPTSSS